MFNRNSFVATLCALMISATAGLASAGTGISCKGLPEPEKTDCKDTKALSSAWFDYLTAVTDVTKQLQESPNFESDPTGLFDIQSGMVLTTITTNMSSSGSGLRGQRPRWSGFDTPDVRIGIDNPDTKYLSKNLDFETKTMCC